MTQQPMQKLAAISILFLVVSLAGPFTAVQPISAAAQASPATWTVQLGGEAGKDPSGQGAAWEFMRFYPDTITVNVGDAISWKLSSMEIHTITFPKPDEQGPALVVPEGGSSQRMLFNPLAVMPQGAAAYDGTTLTGSGQLGGGPPFPTEYKLTFTQPGTFQYICAFHPMMKGTVIVQAPGSAYPKTQAQIDADVKAQLTADADAGTKVEASIKPAALERGPNGTSVYQIQIGYGDGTLAWMRFNPTNLTIHAGDTVKWVQNDVDTPHTITLLSGAKEPDLVLVEPQTNGPPKLVLNPELLGPAGETTYSGQGYFNSGFIWGTKDPTSGPRTYSLTFDTPGTYKYFCALHDDMGMEGQMTVLPKGTQS